MDDLTERLLTRKALLLREMVTAAKADMSAKVEAMAYNLMRVNKAMHNYNSARMQAETVLGGTDPEGRSDTLARMMELVAGMRVEGGEESLGGGMGENYPEWHCKDCGLEWREGD